MHALIRYWTGTGNTARATAVLENALVSQGWSVDRALVRFDTEVPTVAQLSADLVVVACPALGFSAPSHFLRWLNRWPRVTHGQAAVMGIGGAEWGKNGVVPGWSGALLGQLSSRLRRRGFTIVAATDHSYPVNWTQVMAPLAPQVAQEVSSEADGRVREWALSLAGRGGAGVAPLRPSVGRWLIGAVAVVFLGLARRFLGKLHATDGSCTSCGLCERTCPAGVITMQAGRPSWSLDCDACNRCLNLCPPAAIQVTLARVLIHGAGNLVLAVVALNLIGTAGWPIALALFLGGSLIQLTAVDWVLGRLERVRGLVPALTWGWTRRWGRYHAKSAD